MQTEPGRLRPTPAQMAELLALRGTWGAERLDALQALDPAARPVAADISKTISNAPFEACKPTTAHPHTRTCCHLGHASYVILLFKSLLF